MNKLFILFLIFSNYLFCQLNAQPNLGEKLISLNEILIKENQITNEIERMPDLKNNVIYTGKKNEVIQLNRLNADLSTNNTRQVFAKVPGMSIWENDGSGIQVGVATRGLSPNRSWEFNVRQNGYDISSEVFGYPETYYTPPMEALEKIEVIRGAASLQYGPQFGGLLNYRIKKGNPTKKISFETQQTLGSFGLLNTYNALGGTHKKISYYGFLHHRSADGWRNNSQYAINSGYFSVNYQVTKKIALSGEYTSMNYKSQQAGGLSDAQYNENHQQSFRSRNWFGAPYNVASFTLSYDITNAINLQIKSFASFAERNSVGFTNSIITKDSINPISLEYNNRQVDRDKYKNYGTEARMSVKYKCFGKENIFAGGLRAYHGGTIRNQKGVGTNGSDFDLTLTNPSYGRSLEFSTTNLAIFSENIFQLGKRLKIVPGLRFEYIDNTRMGYIDESGTLPQLKKERTLFLYGLGGEFKVSETTNLYGNYSLAYRPVTFSELSPSATTETIDPNLKDASGFNADCGFRGTLKNYLSFDVGLFYLNYDNRIGSISQNSTTYKTNIGTSVSKGIESYVEINIFRFFTDKTKIGAVSIFTSNSFIDAKYVKWDNPLIANDPNKSIQDKQVENAPKYIHRFGLSYCLKGFSATLQLSKVAAVFTDAVNTDAANTAGTIGKLAAYQVMDASFTYKFLKHYNVKAGVNNLTDEKYASRRATGYPGPGILPGNGRTFYFSLGACF